MYTRTHYITLLSNAIVTLAVVFTSVAAVQAVVPTHTYVSRYGDDNASGSMLSPCATFQAAYNKTAFGGTISVLDAGEYGPVVIGHAITIDGTLGQQGTITNASTYAVTITAGNFDAIILRHLAFITAAPSDDGIDFASGGSLIIDDCRFSGYQQDAIYDNGASMIVNDTKIVNGNNGIGIAILSGPVSLHNISITKATLAIYTNGGVTDVSDSVLTRSGQGVDCVLGTVSLENCMISSNNTGLYSATGSIMRLSNCDIFNNITGLSNSGGTISSAGNNKKAGNGTPGVPNGSVTVQ